MIRDELVLEVKDLHTQFDMGRRTVKAVKGISFSLHRGEMIGIVGESGSGKSVTIRSILGLIRKPGRVTQGKVLLEGREIQDLPNKELQKIRGTKFSMVFQEPLTALNPSFTIGWQIGEVYKLHRRDMNKKDRAKNVLDILKKVKIPDSENRYKSYPHQFSGGMRQRGLISIALACKPDILFADEPTTALDVTVQADIMDLIEELRQDMKLSVVFISHNINLITQRCDRVIVMYAGKIVEEALAEQIVNCPLHPYTSGLMASIPDIDHPERPIESIPGDIANLSDDDVGCPFHPRCKHACAQCRESAPAMREIEPGHFCACHLVESKGGVV